LRIGIWAGLALVSVALAYLAARSETGTQRIAGIFESKPAATRGKQLAERPFDAEIEARRLNEAVRLLAADRDRLLARINTLERGLDDVTGSVANPTGTIPGAASSPLPPSLAAPGAPQPGPAQLTPEPTARQAPEPQTRAALEPIPQGGAAPAAPQATPPQAPAPQAAPPPQATARPEPAPGAARPAPEQPAARQPAQKSGAAPPPSANRVTGGHAAVQPGPGATESTITRTEFGIDVGGHTSMDGLRTLWTSLRGSHGALLEGLRPVMAVREGKKPGEIELRLIAGPLANANAAARLCAALSAAGKACQPAVFDGQRLALQ
jgi:hypothetical protein